VKPAPKSSTETTSPKSSSFWMASWERSKSAIDVTEGCIPARFFVA
jgi:hypothetical protein